MLLILFLGGEIHFFASDSVVDVEDVFRGTLEVADAIVGSGDEALVFLTVIQRDELVAHAHKLLLDGSKQIQPRFQLLDWVVSLHVRAHDRHELSFWYDEELVRDAHDVDVEASLQFSLGHDDLAAVLSSSIWDGMVQDADDSCYFSHFLHLVGKIGRISYNKFAFGYLSLRFNSYNFSIGSINYLFNGLVEHVRSSINCSQTSECLWKFSESISGIDERRFSSVLIERITIELNLSD